MASDGKSAAELLVIAEGLVDDVDAGAAVGPASQALQLFRESGDKLSAAKAARFAALGHHAMGKFKEAADLAKQEVEAAKKSGDKGAEGTALLALGEVAVESAGGAKLAMQSAKEAQSIFKGLGDKKMEALSLLAVASVSMSGADKKQASEDARQAATDAVPLFREAGDVKGQALALHRVAAARVLGGAMEGALRSAREALELFQQAGLRKAQAAELHSIAMWLLEDGDAEEATVSATEAMGILEEVYVHAAPRESAYLQTLAKAHLQAGNSAKALKVAKEGLDRFQESGDKSGEGRAYEVVSMVQSQQGHLGRAARSAAKAAYAFEDAGDQKGQATALQSMSRLQCRMGLFDKALRVVQDALNIFEELDDLGEQAKTLQLRAEVFMGKDEVKSAVRCATEARELFQDAKDIKGEAAALLQLSGAELAGEDFGKAARTAEEALGISVEAGDVEGEAAAHRILCDINSKTEQYDAAMKSGQKALSLYRELPEKRAEEANCLMHLSTAQLMSVVKKEKSGKNTEKAFKDGCDKALKFAKESLTVAKKMGDTQYIASALYTIAQCHTMAAKAPEALKAGEEALKLFKQCGDMRGEGSMCVLAGNMAFLLARDFERARNVTEEGIWLFQQVGDAAGEESGWALLDRIDAEIADQKKAQQMLMQAQQMSMQMPMPIMQQPAGDAPSDMPEAAASKPGQNLKLEKLDLSGGLSEEMVHKQIAEVAKGLIGIDEAIDLDMPLMEAGLTSQTAVLLRDTLTEQLPGISLPVTLTFDYPSIGAMGELILENAQKAQLKNK